MSFSCTFHLLTELKAPLLAFFISYGTCVVIKKWPIVNRSIFDCNNIFAEHDQDGLVKQRLLSRSATGAIMLRRVPAGRLCRPTAAPGWLQSAPVA